MGKFIYFLLLFIVGLGFVLIAKLTYVDIAVYRKGVIVKAKIENLDCFSRRSVLYLSIDNNNHSIIIPYTDCTKGKYQLGDSITVKAINGYRRTQFANSNEYIYGILLMIILAIMLIYWIVARKEIMFYLSGKNNSESG